MGRRRAQHKVHTLARLGQHRVQCLGLMRMRGHLTRGRGVVGSPLGACPVCVVGGRAHERGKGGGGCARLACTRVRGKPSKMKPESQSASLILWRRGGGGRAQPLSPQALQQARRDRASCAHHYCRQREQCCGQRGVPERRSVDLGFGAIGTAARAPVADDADHDLVGDELTGVHGGLCGARAECCWETIAHTSCALTEHTMHSQNTRRQGMAGRQGRRGCSMPRRACRSPSGCARRRAACHPWKAAGCLPRVRCVMRVPPAAASPPGLAWSPHARVARVGARAGAFTKLVLDLRALRSLAGARRPEDDHDFARPNAIGQMRRPHCPSFFSLFKANSGHARAATESATSRARRFSPLSPQPARGRGMQSCAERSTYQYLAWTSFSSETAFSAEGGGPAAYCEPVPARGARRAARGAVGEAHRSTATRREQSARGCLHSSGSARSCRCAGT